MRRDFKAAVALAVLALVVPILSQCSSAGTSATATPEAKATLSAPEPAAVKVGDKAPDFTLPDQNGKSYSLSQFRGKENVVLAFYVLAFTGGWTKELQAYQSDLAKFKQKQTQVLGISVDSSPANRAFAKEIGVTFPLLSDFNRTVSKEYGILNAQHGFANRSTFVVDKQGIITHIDKDREALDPTGAHEACSLMAHREAEKAK
jgi:peroxiredoxin